MNPLTKNTFKLLEARRGVRHFNDVYSPYQNHFPALAEVIMPEPFKELEDEEPDLACIIRLCLKELSMNAIITPEYNLTSTI